MPTARNTLGQPAARLAELTSILMIGHEFREALAAGVEVTLVGAATLHKKTRRREG
jgi:hypothetical protein